MRWLFFLIACSATSTAHAQLDSLLRVLNTLPDDTSRLPVLTGLLRATVFSDPDSGLFFAERYLAVAKSSDVAMEIGKGHNYTGMCYSAKGDHDLALEHYMAALSHFEHGDDPWYTAMAHNNVGSVMEHELRFSEATREFRIALKAFDQLNDTTWISNVSNNLGNVYFNRGQKDSAMVFYELADRMLAELGDRASASQVRMNLAVCYLDLGDPPRALSTIRSAVEVHPLGQDELNRANILINYGRVLDANGMHDSALVQLREGVRLAQEYGGLEVEGNGEGLLSDHFEAIGRSDSALVHYKRMVAVDDSLFTAERSAQISEVREKYESGKKDALLAERAAALEQRAITIRAVVVGAILLLLAALFAFRAYRVKRKGEAELASKNAIIEGQLKEKELLLREIHHRVKNNLQVVSSLLSIQGRGITDEKARGAVRDGRDRVKSMALIHQDLYKEDDLTGISMPGYVEKLARSLMSSHQMQPDRIALHVEVQPMTLDVDTAIPLGLILNELITNALKYAWPEGRNGVLAVNMKEVQDPNGDGVVLQLYVQDNGIGYDPSAPRNAEGTGFGLNMIKSFSSKLGAEHSVIRDGGTLARLIIRKYKKVQ